MKSFIVVVSLFSSLSLHLFAEDFITKMEYAKMLYSNPRGIGCNKCHGEKGEGGIISKYTHKGKTVVLQAPDITTISKERFFRAFSVQHKVMPSYFLTWHEIDSLYYYVSSEVK